MTVRCEHVPAAALPILKEQLEAFGSIVTFHTASAGVLDSPAGSLRFEHRADVHVLIIEVIENKGHFPHNLLIGGIRQTVAEAVEILHKQRASRVGAA